MKRTALIIVTLVLFAAASAAQAPKSNWAEYDKGKVHYLDIGKGTKALVLIHGWTCNVDFWKDSYSAFPNHRVIVIDLPGHGKSDKLKTNYTMDYFARSVDAVLRKAGVQEAVLVGHSMGTPVARQFYRLFPEKARGIIIVDGSLTPFFTDEQAQPLLASFRKDFKATSAQFVDSMIQTIKSDAIKKTITDNMLAATEHVAISAMEGMMDKRIWAEDKITVPVLAIMAESAWVKQETKDAFQKIAPNLDFQLWTGVSHFLMMEKPREFNEAVSAFVVKNRLL